MAINIEKALKQVILLTRYPKCTIEAHIWLLECDGNVLSCSINTTSLALNYSGIEMIDFITSTQIITIANKDKKDKLILMDTILSEERNINRECEIIISLMNEKKEITLLNMNGSLSPNETKEILKLCFQACHQLKCLMKKSLFQAINTSKR